MKLQLRRSCNFIRSREGKSLPEELIQQGNIEAQLQNSGSTLCRRLGSSNPALHRCMAPRRDLLLLDLKVFLWRDSNESEKIALATETRKK